MRFFSKIYIILIFAAALLFSECTPSAYNSKINPDKISRDTLIMDMVKRIEEGEFGEIHSLLIQCRDSLLMEKYFHGFSRDSLHPCYSVTKSVTSALLGILMEKEYLSDINDTVIKNLPSIYAEMNLTDYTRSLKINNLLTMTVGFPWDDLYSKNAYEEISKIESSEDWTEYILSLPKKELEEDGFVYNSATAILLSAIIKHRSGLSAEKFAEKNLFNPIGISRWSWNSGPGEISNTSSGLYMRPIDLIQFGSLYLHKGMFEGKQIIPAKWIEQSTGKIVDRGKGSDYGYLWWSYDSQSQMASRLRINDIYFASGYGGQFIWIVPHLNLVVVTTAANFTEGKIIHNLLKDYIIPAFYHN